MSKILRYGMVGGGIGSLIGHVHRKGAEFDGRAKLVAGCFSTSFERTLLTGEELGLDRERLYRDQNEMPKESGERRRIDYVIICTPNYAHYAAAKAFLLQGIHVVCDKPLTFTVEEAEELAQLAEEKGLLFCTTYAYAQCPTAKQAQMMVKNGDIGEIQVVVAEYPMGWLATAAEQTGNKQAAWRTDPKFTGISNCVGDIGTHIENTVSYITGLEIDELCARLDNFGGENVLCIPTPHFGQYKNGAVGNYWCSQVAIGYDNPLHGSASSALKLIECAEEESNTSRLKTATYAISQEKSLLLPEAAG